jgi:hypothetical protein
VAEQGRIRADQPLYFPLRRAPVAQGTEHPPSKRQVAGSNPAWGTPSKPNYRPNLARRLEERADDLSRLRRRHDRDDFSLKEISPTQHPLLQ